ncbi:HNH endonuclease [Kribbella solani]|uniref:HNH endonuclease signature motif containing protein n=1 Tax=Kribbella solani TaxID=236067 RepID=UPI0029A94D67|nr:HNH endonuclease [Kribbella solani]MDX3006209.1 HNH endonuclease [Kribbella solani]
MCDAHHLISWLDGGATTVDNLALLCRRHHADLHAGRWHVTITNGIPKITRPNWASPPGACRPGRRPTERDKVPAPVLSGTTSACSDRPDGIPATPPAPNPWGHTHPPTPRTSRWKADEATLTAAVRFAVWGHRTPTEPATGPPSFATI